MKLNDSFRTHSSPAPHLDLFDPAIADLIRKSAARLCRSSGFACNEAEDIEQDLLMHLWEKSPQYDPDKSPPLAFADLVVKRRIISIVRHRFGQCRDPRRIEHYLDAPCADREGEVNSFHEMLPAPDRSDDRRLAADVATIIDGLPVAAAAEARRLLKHFENAKRSVSSKQALKHREVLWREFAPLVDGVHPAFRQN